ncbi:hypothetical protein [Ancylobacter amanitiformis]|uniref:Uncharacterized protein n=1 Tax=Ancylobacter amanitiformis TaxID=217069 RepID=A0ABU0LQC8_9HYPH|nr:hypothetical protein [Ancylobacter amanitiformis]MDQ0510884.1 hypothetical protein [Ancylobacter amanitiformis]
MQKFAEYEAMVTQAVDDLYGERVRVEPRADSKFVLASADPDRPATTIEAAVVDLQPAVARLRNAGRNDADMAEVSADLCHISIADARLPFALRRGDRFRLIDRPEQPVWAVSKEPEPDGIGRTVFRCVSISEGDGA